MGPARITAGGAPTPARGGRGRPRALKRTRNGDNWHRGPDADHAFQSELKTEWRSPTARGGRGIHLCGRSFSGGARPVPGASHLRWMRADNRFIDGGTPAGASGGEKVPVSEHVGVGGRLAFPRRSSAAN